MVSNPELLQKELAQLNQKAASLYQELVEHYGKYVKQLGTSAQKFMVQTCFELCTERHPQEFLKLPLSQRQTLQQDLQRLGLRLMENLQEAFQSTLEQNPPEGDPPSEIMDHLFRFERSLAQILRETSYRVNRLLEQHGILAIKSLEALFEIAAKAEEAGRSITNPPFLLKAIVDMKEDEEEPVRPLTALYLQIGDLEFADSVLLEARRPIRQLWQRLTQLEQTYQQKLGKLTIAQAAAAWRASWFPYESEK
ncbi:hypothetical protein [Lyngbya confervoides]|uniref:Uncharacterized protein n=1 Tax=Lyngbya confervoides BDU141951 TaxID=1574623 RepID=A0ABD4SZS3_9CYAN|nr:hypothetical protein [Lyngbya confervoides]MCM1981814.1 hypothetical protein [Lyngbya confervoides BDU141951]